MRTVFNILGPLLNPASCAYFLIGVYSEELVPLMGEALHNLGVEMAMVITPPLTLTLTLPLPLTRTLTLPLTLTLTLTRSCTAAASMSSPPSPSPPSRRCLT